MTIEISTRWNETIFRGVGGQLFHSRKVERHRVNGGATCIKLHSSLIAPAAAGFLLVCGLQGAVSGWWEIENFNSKTSSSSLSSVWVSSSGEPRRVLQPSYIFIYVLSTWQPEIGWCYQRNGIGVAISRWLINCIAIWAVWLLCPFMVVLDLEKSFLVQEILVSNWCKLFGYQSAWQTWSKLWIILCIGREFTKIQLCHTLAKLKRLQPST